MGPPVSERGLTLCRQLDALAFSAARLAHVCLKVTRGNPVFPSATTEVVMLRCSGLFLLALGATPALALGQGGSSDLYPSLQHRDFSNQAEESLKQVFVISGYSAAFGAALGTALIPFLPVQEVANIRYVLGGASIGFVLGTGYGFYLMSLGTAAPRSQTPGYPYEGYPGYSYRSSPQISPAELRAAVEDRRRYAGALVVPAFTTQW